MEKYTKIYKEEQTLLFQTNSVACYEVYIHLKNKRDYFKNKNVYDLTRCINEYINIPIRTIESAISKLKKVGLISATRKGKVNYYSFPVLEKIENNNIPTIEENITIMEENNPIMNEDITIMKEDKPILEDNNTIEEEINSILNENNPMEEENKYPTFESVVEAFENELKEIAQLEIDYSRTGDSRILSRNNNIKKMINRQTDYNYEKEITKYIIKEIRELKTNAA